MTDSVWEMRGRKEVMLPPRFLAVATERYCLGTNTLRGRGFGGGGRGEALHLRHIKYEVWERHSNTAVQEASLRALMAVPLLRVGHRKRNLQRDPSRVARKVRVKYESAWSQRPHRG